MQVLPVLHLSLRRQPPGRRAPNTVLRRTYTMRNSPFGRRTSTPRDDSDRLDSRHKQKIAKCAACVLAVERPRSLAAARSLHDHLKQTTRWESGEVTMPRSRRRRCPNSPRAGVLAVEGPAVFPCSTLVTQWWESGEVMMPRLRRHHRCPNSPQAAKQQSTITLPLPGRGSTTRRF